MSSRFGHTLQITTFGESHGGGVGVVVDGCPPRLSISEREIQRDLDRRRPGQSRLTTPRQEADQVEILSGVFEGRSLGTPIALLVRNKDARPSAYEHMKDTYRPSHADYTTEAKYGIRNWQGGGRASARETIGRVAAGAIARKLLAEAAGVQVLGWVKRVHDVEAKIDSNAATLEAVESSLVRCPDPSAADEMIRRIDAARERGDSLGGVVECVARGVPPGLGEPVFHKLEADLAFGMMSAAGLQGLRDRQRLRRRRASPASSTTTRSCPGKASAAAHGNANRSGGVQGGISATARTSYAAGRVQAHRHDLAKRRKPSTARGLNPRSWRRAGRHDPCVLPRAVPMVEAMLCLVLADHWLRQRSVDVLPPLE